MFNVLLKRYIQKTDITEEYRKKVNNVITEKYYLVDMSYNSYGSITRTKKMMSESEYDKIIKQGYFMR
jgi:ATP sulfurylase